MRVEFAATAWVVPAAASAFLCIWGIARLRVPRQAEVLGRIDAGLPERPLSALSDRQATGLSDEVSRSLLETAHCPNGGSGREREGGAAGSSAFGI